MNKVIKTALYNPSDTRHARIMARQAKEIEQFERESRKKLLKSRRKAGGNNCCICGSKNCGSKRRKKTP